LKASERQAEANLEIVAEKEAAFKKEVRVMTLNFSAERLDEIKKYVWFR